ncbi:GNAT family N-acetyltransferase [Curtobacterium luteum]|uniref:GNAT family N-acetyltransferase n=1 Tax=Curtobacterium luteum TaxID=33881 RepID=UPI000A7410D7|nr:GNAT family N-acetyltransferase [Curtobacterium luteum]
MTIATELPTPEELLDLYGAVGWTAYTRDPDVLVAAITGSHAVITARDAGRLVGLARTVSDGATIVYVQDVLVHPEHQRTGVGRALLDEVLRRYERVRQTVLLTDAEPGQRAFYESLGFVEAHDVSPGTLRSFVLLR